MRSAASTRAFLALTALLAAGCGSGTTHPHTAPEEPQSFAPLPADWHHYPDFASGLSRGVPPAWRAKPNGDALIVRSPDRFVAVSATADRTGATLEVPIDRYAKGALAELPGYRGKLDGGKATKLSGTPLDSAVVSTVSVARASGVRQHVTLVVLRLDHLVNYTVVIAANTHTTFANEYGQGVEIARSIRDFPIGGAGL